MNCKTQLGKGRGEMSFRNGRQQMTNTCSWSGADSLPCLLNILCLARGPISCPGLCPAPPVCSSEQPSPSPLPWGLLVSSTALPLSPANPIHCRYLPCTHPRSPALGKGRAEYCRTPVHAHAPWTPRWGWGSAIARLTLPPCPVHLGG